MYRTNGVVQWIISFCIIFLLFYLFVLFLPLFLLIVGGYMIYVWIKVWLLKKRFNQAFYQFDIEDDNTKDGPVIDAEFEILDEKNSK